MRVIIGTYNVHYKLRPEHVEQDLRKLLTETNADVIGLQEFAKNPRAKALDRLCLEFGWEHFQANALRDQDAVPIMWKDSEWELMQTGTQRISEAIDAENGAGGAFIESKFATWVLLQRRHGNKCIGVINWHAPGSVENPDNVKRRKSLVQCTRGVRTLARTLRRQVDALFITGDMNVNYRRDTMRTQEGFPIEEFREAGLPANWSWDDELPRLGTHFENGLLTYDVNPVAKDERIIDYVFGTAPPTRSLILRGYASDHRPVLAVYQL